MGTVSRFAPSPTGYLHIGGLRTAIFAWLFAKANKGKVLLRFEDTDQERSKEEFTKSIMESFSWMDIDFDEKPYLQSKAKERHIEVAENLLRDGNAYYCSCTNERLDDLRKEQMKKGLKPKYDRKCRDLNLKPDANYVIRFKNPIEGEVSFKDLVRGQISFSNDELDDLVLVRNNGLPTYNLCVVVDDVDMGVTHIIRGEDHINNTPRQLNILTALKESLPQYGHVPMILGEDKKRMSKRHGAVNVIEFKEQGILPEALLNYLVRLGWSLGDRELFSKADLIDNFQKGRINNSPAIFSMEKLLWFNKEYLSSLDFSDLEEKVSKFAKSFSQKSEYSRRVLHLIRTRCSTLIDFQRESHYFFNDVSHFEENLVKEVFTEESKEILSKLLKSLEPLDSWKSEEIQKIINLLKEDLGVGMPQIGKPLRLAIAGTLSSPSIDETVEVLGKEKVISRLEQALDKFS
tara:strand:+ start:35 stop:1417 length:1383 start_codon:yes stop_codon:yes gene_type:complete